MSDDLARIFSLVTPTCKDIHKSTRFVKEGAAKWANAKAPKEPSNVYLFLISHALLLCEPQADGKYKLIFFINLKADLRVPDDENPLYYNVVSPKKPFQFEAANEQDRVEWQTALRFTLEGLPLPIFREVDGQRVWDPIASLTAEQVSILDDFRTQVHAHLAAADPPYPQEIHDFANDATLLRFLRARQWTVAKSLLMITGTFKWRSEYKPQQIRLAEIEREIVSGKLYISERRDKIGRPVVYYKTRIDDTAHDDVRVRNMVWLLEELTRRMDTPHTGCERSVWLVDFEHADFNSGKLKSQMDVSIDIIKIMQAHYPESLGKCFLIEAPLLFKTIWAAVTPFIDQVTQRKVNFIEKKKAIRDGLLMEYFDKDNLETEFGGSFENPWDFERWKSNLLPNSFPSESTPE